MSQADFWIVTGTASPVIALAAVVAARDALALPFDRHLPTRLRRRQRTLALVSYGASAVNILAQAFVMLASLSYLASSKLPSGGLGTTPAMILEFLGILALQVSAFAGVAAKDPRGLGSSRRRKVIDDDTKPGEELTSSA